MQEQQKKNEAIARLISRLSGVKMDKIHHYGHQSRVYFSDGSCAVISHRRMKISFKKIILDYP